MADVATKILGLSSLVASGILPLEELNVRIASLLQGTPVESQPNPNLLRQFHRQALPQHNMTGIERHKKRSDYDMFIVRFVDFRESCRVQLKEEDYGIDDVWVEITKR